MDKLISADGFKEILIAKSDLLRTGCPDNQYGIFLRKVSQMIDLMPEASVPVLRCKDCAWRTKFADGGRYCIVLNRAVQDDFWCASAFRKEKKDADK